MKVVASAEAREHVRSSGGRLYVWADPHRCCGGGTTLLNTSVTPPRREGLFTEVPADGLEVYFDPGRLVPPDELHLELRGWPRRRIRAYWNGCAFVM